VAQAANTTESGLVSKRLFSSDWGIEAGKVVLYGADCRACENKLFPRTTRCPLCLSKEVHPLILPREGMLYSFSIVRVDSPQLRAPYAIGYVDLPGGPRVFAHLVGWEDQQLQPDIRVRLTYGPLPLKNESLTELIYKFEPIKVHEPGSCL
jgi:uncharacterized OB-fold protein